MTGNVEVRVRRNGQVIATIQRPLRDLNGEPAITYKNQLWPLVAGCIEVGGSLQAVNPQLSSQIERLGYFSRSATAEPMLPSPATQPEVENFDARTWRDDPVSEPHDARVIVDAGPGTGKTHAACARVASMVNSCISATRILLVSFTRTAVVEIRNRIAHALNDPSDADSVRIITLDSFAWTLHSGYANDAKLTNCFNDNIEKARSLIKHDPDVRDDLARVEHLIIDEGQDIVGPRADLIITLIDALNSESGVTVFADRAQAIYAFSESRDEPEGTNLLDALDKCGFRQLTLTHVHRTKDPNLLAIFTGLRNDLLAGGRKATEHHVKREIQRLAHEDIGKASELPIVEIPEDSLVLMRNRLDVLLASSYAGTHPHRLRMSGLPVCIRPWLGHVLWDYTPRRITSAEFEKRWQDRDVRAPHSCEEAWKRCLQVAGESAQVVDLHKLRASLARATPPMLFCSPEFGVAGAIIGTIHASKGREATNVYLYLPERASVGETGEEARVMFVGATRPRERLLVGSTGANYGQYTNGRVWRRMANKIQIEVGRPFDIDPTGLVGRPCFPRQEAALASQHAWISKPMREFMVISMQESLGWRFALSDGDQLLASMSERFCTDIDNIASQLKKRITWLGHSRSLGLRTMVVAPDSPDLGNMLEPWKSSGFLFAPLLSSLSLAKLRSR